MGSSPLARGPHNAVTVVDEIPGLIPARAGTTGRLPQEGYAGWAHPRSRGDHAHSFAALKSYTGLIPARAGTTSEYCFLASSSWAHPRSRGDHLQSPELPCLQWGSSPLARGPPCQDQDSWLWLGLIPARAGTTPLIKSTLRMTRAHPRSRGDHFVAPSSSHPR